MAVYTKTSKAPLVGTPLDDVFMVSNATYAVNIDGAGGVNVLHLSATSAKTYALDSSLANIFSISMTTSTELTPSYVGGTAAINVDFSGYGVSGTPQLFGNLGPNLVTGSNGPNEFFGIDGNDSMQGAGGDDSFRGSSGVDVAQYAGNLGDFLIDLDLVYCALTVSDLAPAAQGDEGTDQLYSAERLVFADATVQVDVPGAWDGVATGERLLGSHTYAEDYEPAVAGLANGGHVVVWANHDGQFGVRAQVFSDLGTPLGTEFQVNQASVYSGSDFDGPLPRVASLGAHGFVVTWTGVDESGKGVFARLYNASGTPTSDAFLINSTTDFMQGYGSVSALEDGFVAAWTSEVLLSPNRVFVQRFDFSGAAVGEELQVNATMTGQQGGASVATLADGDFVVAWTGYAEGYDSEIFAQRYDGDGTPQGSTFRVNTYRTDFQSAPSIAALENGGFLVAWTSYAQDGNGNGVYAQRFGADGNAQGVEFKVNAYTLGHQIAGQVVGLSDGGFLVTWEGTSATDDFGVYAQVYAANGSASGSAFLLNTPHVGTQHTPVAATLGGGGFVTAWSDGFGFTNTGVTDVASQRFSADGMREGVRVMVAGDASNNTLHVGNNITIVDGGGGADSLYGGTNDNIYLADNSGDKVYEAANGGLDIIRASADYVLPGNVEQLLLMGSGAISGTGNSLVNTITGNGGANTLEGLGGADSIYGGAGDDALRGSNGKDRLDGEEGKDRLKGGAGNDKLSGGGGADKFVFDTALDAATNNDTIKDFKVSGHDKIVLDAHIFESLVGMVGGLASENFSNTGVATDEDDYIVYNPTTGVLYYDADGNGAGAQIAFATLTTHPALNSTCFLVA